MRACVRVSLRRCTFFTLLTGSLRLRGDAGEVVDLGELPALAAAPAGGCCCFGLELSASATLGCCDVVLDATAMLSGGELEVEGSGSACRASTASDVSFAGVLGGFDGSFVGNSVRDLGLRHPYTGNTGARIWWVQMYLQSATGRYPISTNDTSATLLT